jgi:hypothetical protein
VHFYPFQNDMRSLTVGRMFFFMARDPQRIDYGAEVIRRARALATFPFEFNAESNSELCGFETAIAERRVPLFRQGYISHYVSILFLFVIGSLFTLIK